MTKQLEWEMGFCYLLQSEYSKKFEEELPKY